MFCALRFTCILALLHRRKCQAARREYECENDSYVRMAILTVLSRPGVSWSIVTCDALLLTAALTSCFRDIVVSGRPGSSSRPSDVEFYVPQWFHHIHFGPFYIDILTCAGSGSWSRW